MVEYTAGTNKGETRQGDLINSPFQLGGMQGTRADGTHYNHVDYTSAKVVEQFTLAAGDITTTTSSNDTATITAAWYPVYNGDAAEAKARLVTINGTAVTADVAVDVSGTNNSTVKFVLSTGSFTANDVIKVAYV